MGGARATEAKRKIQHGNKSERQRRGDQKVKPRRLKQLLGLAQTIIPQRPSVAPFLLIRKQLRQFGGRLKPLTEG